MRLLRRGFGLFVRGFGLFAETSVGLSGTSSSSQRLSVSAASASSQRFRRRVFGLFPETSVFAAESSGSSQRLRSSLQSLRPLPRDFGLCCRVFGLFAQTSVVVAASRTSSQARRQTLRFPCALQSPLPPLRSRRFHAYEVQDTVGSVVLSRSNIIRGPSDPTSTVQNVTFMCKQQGWPPT